MILQIVLRYSIHFISAMMGVIAFSAIFHAPKSEYLACGLTGTIGWLTYCVARDLGTDVMICNFIATTVLTLIARIIVIIRRNPITVYLVPGIFPLVPGAGIYYTAYYMFTGYPQLAVTKGIETIEVAGAITMGIIFGSFIAYEYFRQQREFRRLMKD